LNQEVSDALADIAATGKQGRLRLEGKYRISSPITLPKTPGLVIEGASLTF
jgi:hypothetical protein